MRFKPGQSGNPIGRPRIPAEVRELARGATLEAIQLYIETMRDRGLDPELRMKAADRLMDRAWGKPTQAVDHVLAPGDLEPVQSDRPSEIEVAKRVAFILERGRAAMALQATGNPKTLPRS